MKFLVLIAVLRRAAASSLRLPSGAAEIRPALEDIIEEGATQSGNARRAKRPQEADSPGKPLAKTPKLDVQGPHIEPPTQPGDSGFFSGGFSAATRRNPVVPPSEPGGGALGVDIAESDIHPVGNHHPSIHAPSGSSSGGTGAAAVSGRRRPSEIVIMNTVENGFLARLSSLFGPSFADLVVNPSVTRRIELEPINTPVDDETGGIGTTKYAEFYKLKGTEETVVVKWYFDALPLNTQAPSDVVVDFFTQSILHLLSKLYSDPIVGGKVYYMQPLLVTSLMDDGIHYGLMERKFEQFDSLRTSWNEFDRFVEFSNFLSFDKRFILPHDPQGWYLRDSHLYMTDGLLELFDGQGGSDFIQTNDNYDLPLIYEMLIGKVTAMKREPMDLSVGNTGKARHIFGKSRADDEATIRNIQDTKIECLRL
eukprot:GEMP01033266.1.p1 GENE.GEMP01033266.1~~GEMP01033266.1.p1  ORF type:complete len:423 (+),score=60.11 GEMP01033266.1:157-1425(+)